MTDTRPRSSLTERFNSDLERECRKFRWGVERRDQRRMEDTGIGVGDEEICSGRSLGSEEGGTQTKQEA